MGFKEDFLKIVANRNGAYDNNEPAEFLIKKVAAYAEQTNTSFFEAADLLIASNLPKGSVNVDHQKGVGYGDGEGTEITAEIIVADALAGGGVPDWWDCEWTTGQIYEEIEQELAAEAEDNAAVGRTRFRAFGIGNGIMLQYSHDNDFIYEKKGRVVQKAEIDELQLNALNSMATDDYIGPAHIFSEASGGRSSAPINFLPR